MSAEIKPESKLIEGLKRRGGIFPSLEEGSCHACATKTVQSDTWEAINKTEACCFLWRRSVGQVKEKRAHPRNLTHTHTHKGE